MCDREALWNPTFHGVECEYYSLPCGIEYCRKYGHAWDSDGTILRPAVCYRCGEKKCRDCDEAMAAGSEGGFCEKHESEEELA